MNSNEFMDWLSGYLEAIPDPTKENIEVIKKRLRTAQKVQTNHFDAPNTTRAWPTPTIYGPIEF